MTALKSAPTSKSASIEARCAATGMRMTEQRRVIARVLADAVDHPDVEELYRRCAAVDDKISISTVYRTVKLFEDAGIIERHDFREGRAPIARARRRELLGAPDHALAVHRRHVDAGAVLAQFCCFRH